MVVQLRCGLIESKTNSPIQGRNDALEKAKAVAECLEDQLKPLDSDYNFRDHYNQVMLGVQLFRNTSFDSSIKTVSHNDVRKIIKQLKPNKAPG